MTLRDRVASAAVAGLSVALAACGSATAGPANAGSAGVCAGQTGVSSARSTSYVVVLVATTEVISAVAAQSTSSSPSSAPPVILSGTEASVDGPGATHFELHICDRSTGAVAVGLHPEATLRDASTGAAPEALPLAVLQDAGQGVSGTAYGNNAMLQQEHTYIIDATIDAADEVSLSYQVPVTGPTPSPSPGGQMHDMG
ncbi:MAG: hypothetical protein JOZ75_03170 [Candidatus Dormibacteraeota bacterium]|nr:hypothetical protein [Candidatus Dormibacteraeota bacterium]